MKKYGLYIAAASAILLAAVAGKWISGQVVNADCFIFLLPAACGAASLFLLQKMPLKLRIFPLISGVLPALLYHPAAGENSFWEMLFAPAAAAGIMIFLTGILILVDYLQITLQKFRDIAAGKIPKPETYEEE